MEREITGWERLITDWARFKADVAAPPAIPGNKVWIILGFCAEAPVNFILSIDMAVLIFVDPGFAFFSLMFISIVSILMALALPFAYDKGKNVPPHVIGRHIICLDYLVSVLAAVLLRVFLVSHFIFIYALVAYSIYLRSLVRLQYNILDLRIRNALLAAFMQCLVYFTLLGNSYVFVGVLVLCVILVLLQDFTYKVSDHVIDDNNNTTSRRLFEFIVSGRPVEVLVPTQPEDRNVGAVRAEIIGAF